MSWSWQIMQWTEAYAIPNQEAMTVARKLTNEFFFRFSPPEQLHSGQGEFESEIISEVSRLLGVAKMRRILYYPQTDSLVECFNQTFVDILSTVAGDPPFDWERHLRLFYNTSVHRTTARIGQQPHTTGALLSSVIR